jgi:hypothetical protein
MSPSEVIRGVRLQQNRNATDDPFLDEVEHKALTAATSDFGRILEKLL